MFLLWSLESQPSLGPFWLRPYVRKGGWGSGEVGPGAVSKRRTGWGRSGEEASDARLGEVGGGEMGCWEKLSKSNSHESHF